jgi:hypothetical protein
MKTCRGLDDKMLQPICIRCGEHDNPNELVRELCEVVSILRFKLAVERALNTVKENRC